MLSHESRRLSGSSSSALGFRARALATDVETHPPQSGWQVLLRL